MSNFPFVGGSYTARSRSINAERTVNLYPENEPGASKSPTALLCTPGLLPFASLNGQAGRGIFRFSPAILVAVAGLSVYLIDSNGYALLVGAIDGVGPVSMESNGQQVLIATGTNGWFLDPVARTLTPANYAMDRVAYLDGYLVFNESGTGRFRITQNTGTTINPLDFATAEGSPDNLISLIVDHRELWLFGASSTEVWYDSGNSDFPMERIQGAFIEVGCAAVDSVAKLDNSIFWLAADDRGQGIVMRSNGYTPQRLSTHAVEYAINSYSTVSDAVAYTYQQEGHAFYVLTFPTANATWVYDAATQMWHERAWMNPADSSLNRHRVQSHAAFAGENIGQDWQTGALYKIDLDTYTDNGAAIPRIRRCPHIAGPTYKRMMHHALQIDMETGFGLASGADPQAVLRVSDDGGVSFPRQYQSTIGHIGERLARVRYRRLGIARDRVYELVITDPVKVAIVGAALEVEVCKS